MRFINYNGKILPAETPIISADSRAARYGDGIFETIKLKNNVLLFADDHFARLWKGMQALKFDIPKLLTPEKLQADILQLAKKNSQSNCRIRLAIYRGNGGLYDAENHVPNYLIQSWPLAEENGQLNSNGLQLCFYKNALKATDQFANLKHNNYLPYFMGALHAKEMKCNDAIIFNTNEQVCDSTIANIFMIKNEAIFTPPLSSGCIAGVLRKFLLAQIPATDFTIKEKELTAEDLLNADEIFLTNSIYNIRWVAGLNDRVYSNAITLKIDTILRQTNSAVYC